MSQYTKSTNFATKDNLTPGDPLKIVRGTEIDTEYNNIATAIATKTDNSSAAITGGTINATTIGATTASTGAFSTLSATGAITSTLATGTAPLVIASTTKVANLNVDSLDGADWASPAALGSTTPAAVSATTLTTSSTVTHNGGTANGVTYLNGSNVLTSGSALTYNGTGLGVGVASSLGILQVRPQANANMLWQNSTFGSGGVLLNVINDAGSANATLDFQATSYQFAISGSEQMRLTSTGLGIGTSSPAYKLHVASGATAATSYFSSTATPAYSATAYNGGNARIAMNGGGASGATTGINFSQGGSFEVYFGGVQESGGAAAFVWQGYNGSAYVERMRLDASGRLLVGTTNALSNSLTTFGNNTGATGKAWGISTLSNAGGIAPPTDTGLSFGWNYSDAGGENNIVYGVSAGSSPALTFSTYNGTTVTERCRLDASGNLLVGTTSQVSTAVLGISGGASRNGIGVTVASGMTGMIFSGTAAYNYNAAVFNYNTSTQVGYIQVQSTSTVYSTSSDYRLKNSISPMTGALAKVALLKPCTYKWNVDGSDGQGFIAHELAEVVPQAVVGAKDAVDKEGKPQYQGIDTSFLVATLTAAIQEQQAIINSLKARLDAANL